MALPARAYSTKELYLQCVRSADGVRHQRVRRRRHRHLPRLLPREDDHAQVGQYLTLIC